MSIFSNPKQDIPVTGDTTLAPDFVGYTSQDTGPPRNSTTNTIKIGDPVEPLEEKKKKAFWKTSKSQLLDKSLDKNKAVNGNIAVLEYLISSASYRLVSDAEKSVIDQPDRLFATEAAAVADFDKTFAEFSNKENLKRRYWNWAKKPVVKVVTVRYVEEEEKPSFRLTDDDIKHTYYYVEGRLQIYGQ